VKNASGCRSTCRNTLARSSSTRLAPIQSEYHDLTYPAPAATSASPATASASVTTQRAGMNGKARPARLDKKVMRAAYAGIYRQAASAAPS